MELLTRILDKGHEVKFWMRHNGEIVAEIVNRHDNYVAEGCGQTPAEAVEALWNELQRVTN